MTNRYTEPARYFVTDGPFFDRSGNQTPYVYLVVEQTYVSRKHRPLRVLAHGTTPQAANAARRLLSGECEVRP